MKHLKIFEDFELYVTGGLLEPWLSWDIDFVLTGPYKPDKIYKILKLINDLSFYKYKIYSDTVYTKKTYWLYEYQNGIPPIRTWHYEMSNYFRRDWNVAPIMKNYEKVECGLWRSIDEFPKQKNLDLIESGHIYQPPVRIL